MSIKSHMKRNGVFQLLADEAAECWLNDSQEPGNLKTVLKGSRVISIAAHDLTASAVELLTETKTLTAHGENEYIEQILLCHFI